MVRRSGVGSIHCQHKLNVFCHYEYRIPVLKVNVHLKVSYLVYVGAGSCFSINNGKTPVASKQCGILDLRCTIAERRKSCSSR
jgi:hypothetical protein